MNFIDVVKPEPIGGFLSALPLIAAIATGVFLVLMVIVGVTQKSSGALATYIIFSILFLVSGVVWIGSGTFTMTHNMPKYGEQQDAARELTEKTYGIDLNYEQFSDLDYPSGKPTAKFKVFGKTHTTFQTVGTGFREADIYLVWADGEFGLAESSNGKNFDQIPIAEEDK